MVIVSGKTIMPALQVRKLLKLQSGYPDFHQVETKVG